MNKLTLGELLEEMAGDEGLSEEERAKARRAMTDLRELEKQPQARMISRRAAVEGDSV